MTSASPSPFSNVIRYKRPPKSRAQLTSLRLEGSLAAVTTLAPVIPIFPALALAAAHRATSLQPTGCRLLGDLETVDHLGELPTG